MIDRQVSLRSLTALSDRFAMGDVGAAGPKPRLGISSPDPFFASRGLKLLTR